MIHVYSERRRGKPIEIGFNVPLENLRYAIMEAGKQAMLPIETINDEVKIGSGFGVKAIPCIVIYNTQHRRDYYNIVLVLEKHYNTYYFSSYLGGNSSNYMNSVMPEVGGAVMKHIKRSAQRKLEEEHIFYDLLDKAIVEAFEIAITLPYEDEKSYNSPPLQTSRPQPEPQQTRITQQEPQKTKKHSSPTQSQPQNDTNIQQKITSEVIETSNGVLKIMWFVWILLAAMCITFGGVQAILTDILGIILLYWAQKLLQKDHLIWAILPIYIGGFCLSAGIMMFSAEVGVIVSLICSIIFYFSCWK